MQNKPKQLWYADLNFRQPGRWLPKEEFFLGKPYKPEIPMKYKCHVLYESPMEAFLSLHKQITEHLKKNKTFDLKIFIYSTRAHLITKANYFPPDLIAEKEIFSFDQDLLNRHLIRQSLDFQRAGTLSISYNQFDKAPIFDLFFTNKLDKEKFLMTIRKPKVTMTYGLWSKYMCKSVEKALFNFAEFPFLSPLTLKIHDPKRLEKKNATERNLEST